MEIKLFGGDNASISKDALLHGERIATLKADYLCAGVLLEDGGIEWWSRDQAGEMVKELRARRGIFENMDILSGSGYTAIRHLLDDGSIVCQPEENKPLDEVYQVVRKNPEEVQS